MKNSSNVKGKNREHQPANIPHYYQELGYNAVRRLTRSYIRWNPNLQDHYRTLNRALAQASGDGPPLRSIKNWSL